MLSSDPELFLKSLSTAFFAQTTESNSIARRNAHFFDAAKSAAIARLVAMCRIIPKFENLSKLPRTTERYFEEDQLLYEFFSHAYSLVDSFCFGAYFVGSQLSPANFEPNPKLRSINSRRTRECFEIFDGNSAFTKALGETLDSEEYETIDIRNMLSHRIIPGRTIRAMVDRHLWNLDMWFEGDWSNVGPGIVQPPKKQFYLESKSLIELRDWSDHQLAVLGNELESVAASHGL
jgi:hypothetical protein